jgi:hypothetical protein
MPRSRRRTGEANPDFKERVAKPGAHGCSPEDGTARAVTTSTVRAHRHNCGGGGPGFFGFSGESEAEAGARLWHASPSAAAA